jgi:hypothetical protein
MRSLIENKSGSSGGEVLQKDDWNHEILLCLLRQARPDHPVKIWTTFFVNDSKELDTIRDLAKTGVRFEILVMRPDNTPLVRSRFRVRKGYTDNPPILAQQRIESVFNALQEVSGVTVKTCDNMPFGMFYQIGDQVMLVGLMMPGNSWEHGPLMKWYPSSRQWKVFEEHWAAVWQNPLDPVQAAPTPPATPVS